MLVRIDQLQLHNYERNLQKNVLKTAKTEEAKVNFPC